jgi:hypothetical protein
MNTLQELQKEVDAIKKRNAKVETNKAWETSWTRRGLITLLTYMVVVLFFHTSQLPQPWLNAIVPSGAFVLSTLSVPFVKSWWLKQQ